MTEYHVSPAPAGDDPPRSPDEAALRAAEAEAAARGNKFRYMTPAEEAAAFFGRERDLIHKDWVEAEKVVEAARALLSKPTRNPAFFRPLADALAAYDAYLAAERAKAAEPSGLPERGLVSRGRPVKGAAFPAAAGGD